MDNNTAHSLHLPARDETRSAGIADAGGGAPGGRAVPSPRRSLSETLVEIGADESRSEITLSDLMRLMEGRARAALIFLFAFPNVFPAPPGLSAILGLPLLYLTAQMMLGRVPWLPAFIGARAMPRAGFAAMVGRALPVLERAERMLRPRWSWIVSHRAEKLLGLLALALAIVVTLPIPLGNMLPAFAVCLVALGVLERDGLWAGLGVIVGAGALALSATVVLAMLKGALFVVVGMFS